MDPALGFTQQLEGVNGALLYPRRKLSSPDQRDQLTDMPVRTRGVRRAVTGVVVVIMVVMVVVVIVDDGGWFFLDAARKEDVHLDGLHPATMHRLDVDPHVGKS